MATEQLTDLEDFEGFFSRGDLESSAHLESIAQGQTPWAAPSKEELEEIAPPSAAQLARRARLTKLVVAVVGTLGIGSMALFGHRALASSARLQSDPSIGPRVASHGGTLETAAASERQGPAASPVVSLPERSQQTPMSSPPPANPNQPEEVTGLGHSGLPSQAAAATDLAPVPPTTPSQSHSVSRAVAIAQSEATPEQPAVCEQPVSPRSTIAPTQRRAPTRATASRSNVSRTTQQDSLPAAAVNPTSSPAAQTGVSYATARFAPMVNN